MSPPVARGWARARRCTSGVVFLGLVAGAAWLAAAVYQDRFADVVDVVLEADRAGNQMSRGADVKVRGVLVGEVREVETSGDGARLHLAIDRDRTERLTTAATARLLPKTLFGEKYVALSPAAGGEPLRDGAVLAQDQTETARETAQALDDLLPLLQALEPEQLSTTLSAVAGALRGRGERIGRNLERVDAYLRELNRELPEMREGFRGLADYADSLDVAAPDLLSVLDDLSASSRSLVDQRDELGRFLSSTTAMAAEADDLLRRNDELLVALARDSVPVVRAYARYAPEYACMLHGITAIEEEGERTFGGAQPGLHITLEMTRNNGPYVPGDEPRFGDDAGPTCYGLEGEPIVPFPAYRNPEDGYRDGQPVDPDTGEHGPGGGVPPAPDSPATALAPTSARSGDAVLRLVGAAALQRPVDDVPDLVALLLGPLARGTTVALR